MEKKKITLKTILLNLDAIITGITLTLATIIVNTNVLMRYFMKSPLLWAEEVATGLFVWTVFVGSAYAYRKHAHLGVDILVNALPEKVRAVVKVVMDVLGLFVLIMLTYVSVLYVYNTLDVYKRQVFYYRCGGGEDCKKGGNLFCKGCQYIDSSPAGGTESGKQDAGSAFSGSRV